MANEITKEWEEEEEEEEEGRKVNKFRQATLDIKNTLT
jgi:hypothetical protein